MYQSQSGSVEPLADYRIDPNPMRYSQFVPRLYGLCLGLGMEQGRIMPSRAFCSDESQGYPVILLAKHFGAFPFNHGQVGGVVSLERHGPHADHGKDLLLVQASHVGHDPETGEFGVYRRLHTEDNGNTCNCGKVGHILESYRTEYAYARENIRLLRHEGQPAVLIDNLLLSAKRSQGLFLVVENLVRDAARGLPAPIAARSTGAVYAAAESLVARIGEAAWPAEGRAAIGARLAADDFFFKRDWGNTDPTQNQLERNIVAPMPWILTSRHPFLTAACANTLAEFDRCYRSLSQPVAMRGKNLLFVAGVNIDISPYPGETFPMTKFAPWAAFVQYADGPREILEQDELIERLGRYSNENPSQLSLDKNIAMMTEHREVTVRL